MSVPWKNENNNLSSNYEVAKIRYIEVIQGFINHGIVEPVDNIVSDNPMTTPFP